MTWTTINNLITNMYHEEYFEGGFGSNFIAEKINWIIN